MAVLSLIRSAFGHSCLYKSLDVSPSCTADELKRAYRQSARKYHPDRASNSADDAVAATTLKFQAVSAAYQILMDEKKRSVYDKSGRIDDDDSELSDNEDHGHVAARRYAHNNDHWESFFYSIFHEMINAKSIHDEDSKYYRGSSREERDVIEYYNICKGDWNKVVECITFGDRADVERWKRDIIKPALIRGAVQDFESSQAATVAPKTKAAPMGDSASSDDDIPVGKSGKRKIQTKRKHITLDDSSSDEDIETFASRNRRLKKKPQQTSSLEATAPNVSSFDASMSKRDKLEYRTAKKRKHKKEKEMEVVELFQSKDWGGSFSTNGDSKKRTNAGSLSNQTLANIERKYAKAGSKSKKRA